RTRRSPRAQTRPECRRLAPPSPKLPASSRDSASRATTGSQRSTAALLQSGRPASWASDTPWIYRWLDNNALDLGRSGEAGHIACCAEGPATSGEHLGDLFVHRLERKDLALNPAGEAEHVPAEGRPHRLPAGLAWLQPFERLLHLCREFTAANLP